VSGMQSAAGPERPGAERPARAARLQRAGAERPTRAARPGAERPARAARLLALRRPSLAPLAALASQAGRFALVGATNTALTLGAYSLLVLAGLPGPLAAALGWALGAANGYRLNRGWTFRSALRGLTPAARYVAVQALGAGLSAVGVALAHGDAHLPHLEGEIAILPAVTLLTFALCRGWVFA
jgi:putative flippase GtrA